MDFGGIWFADFEDLKVQYMYDTYYDFKVLYDTILMLRCYQLCDSFHKNKVAIISSKFLFVIFSL